MPGTGVPVVGGVMATGVLPPPPQAVSMIAVAAIRRAATQKRRDVDGARKNDFENMAFSFDELPLVLDVTNSIRYRVP